VTKTYSASEAAEIIGGKCKASWLREKARRRLIPFTMIAGAYHWTDAQIDAIVKMGEQQPGRQQRQPAQRRTTPVPVQQDQSAVPPLLVARVPKRMRVA
jgi:hypothetical protein